jgi:hypothetical protein
MIKSIEAELWTKEEISFLRKGGNTRFNSLIYEYNIPITVEYQEFKYHTKIAEYYRQLLLSEVKGSEFTLQKLELKEGIGLMAEKKKIQPQNVNETNSVKQTDNINKNEQPTKVSETNQEPTTMISSFGKFFEKISLNISNNKVVQTVKSTAESGFGYIQEKASSFMGLSSSSSSTTNQDAK